uniref:Glycine-rich protein n=1 Tax=Oryza punctata TaxID=4537 RepID=A0A0E0L7G0_ORYPU
MERGRNGRDDFFGGRDPFAGFGGFGRQRSLISGVFGGRDPFDDPFFTQPFGSGMHGPNPFVPMGGPFGDMRNDGFLEQAPPRGNGRKPIITELDEEEGENSERHHQANREPYVQEPDDEMQGGQLQPRRDFNRANEGQPQTRTFTYQSSSVTYGGVNGAYYTASKTRRTGSDGITVEESKEADTTTKEATHRISRGIHDKGHSLTRKLKSDGKVDTTQILHNLHEDELAGFEESWKGNAGHHLPGLNQNAGTSNNNGPGNRGTSGRGRQSAWGWALPGTEQGRDQRRNGGRPKSRVIPIS